MIVILNTRAAAAATLFENKRQLRRILYTGITKSSLGEVDFDRSRERRTRKNINKRQFVIGDVNIMVCFMLFLRFGIM